MITVFLLGMQTTHAGLFSSSPSHKEEGQQEILNRLELDVREALEKRKNYNPKERQKQQPALQVLLARSEELLKKLQEDKADYEKRRKEDQRARTLKRIKEVKLQIDLIKQHRMNTGEVYG